MNVTEANAVNTLLGYMLELDTGSGVPSGDAAWKAALHLTEQSRERMGAGLWPADVEDAWTVRPPGMAERYSTDAEDCPACGSIKTCPYHEGVATGVTELGKAVQAMVDNADHFNDAIREYHEQRAEWNGDAR